MLPHFFAYYDKLVNRYVFYDDGSTDRTLEILNKHPKVEIRTFPRLYADSYVLAAQEIHNNCWKESKGIADWIINTPADEFLYTPNLASYLVECKKKGITAIPALGYQMVSRSLPPTGQSPFETIRSGCPWVRMNKLSIFNPNKIININQAAGRHSAEPSGQVKYPEEDRLLNLHYKYLSFEYTFNRHQELNGKLGTFDKQNNWGRQYRFTRNELEKEFKYFEDHAVKDVFSSRYNPHLEHSDLSERWWRKQIPTKNKPKLGKIRKTAGRWPRWLKLLPFRIWMRIPESTRQWIKRFHLAKELSSLIKKLLLS